MVFSAGFYLFLESAREEGKKVTRKTIKCKTGSSSKMQSTFFDVKDSQNIFEKTIKFDENLEVLQIGGG